MDLKNERLHLQTKNKCFATDLFELCYGTRNNSIEILKGQLPSVKLSYLNTRAHAQ